MIDIETLSLRGDLNKEVKKLCIDSRNCVQHSLFVAIRGSQQDGHQFIDQAIASGASSILCQELPDSLSDDITYIQVEDSSLTAGLIAANFYGHPSKQFKLVGVTGTNGKTTCASLLFQLFKSLGYKAGLISTVSNIIDDKVLVATHTTPNAIELQDIFSQMLEASCDYVFMEVSSHAIHQNRIAGATFEIGLFTNISHDHLDYHETFDEYIRVKKLFFDNLNKDAYAIVNADDKRGLVMLQNTKAQKRTVSLKSLADYKGKILENGLQGLYMHVNEHEVHFKMIGEFNAYNLLTVFAAADCLGMDKAEVLAKLSLLEGAEGRFDYVISPIKKIMGIVDYAHTPDALINVLGAINKLRNGNEVLHTVVGCGGDRDKTKRPLMAHVACEHSDKVILTSDNPRTENPESILDAMESGVPVNLKKKYVRISNRKDAIKTACNYAAQGDIILVAGKGHEKYQEIDGVKYPFDDKAILHEMFELMEK